MNTGTVESTIRVEVWRPVKFKDPLPDERVKTSGSARFIELCRPAEMPFTGEQLEGLRKLSERFPNQVCAEDEDL